MTGSLKYYLFISRACRAVGAGFKTYDLRFKKLKISKCPISVFIFLKSPIFLNSFFHLCNDIQLCWNCNFDMAESLLLGCNFVSGICKLKSKKLRNLKKPIKKL